MANAFTKRLEKLEAMMASRINAPLAFIFVNTGETNEEAAVRCGYDVSQLDRIRFVRWLDPARGEAPPEYSWETPEPGPPSEAPLRIPDPEPTSSLTSAPTPSVSYDHQHQTQVMGSAITEEARNQIPRGDRAS
jgi:hypothetical protein